MVVLWIVPSDEDSAKLKTIMPIHSATSTGSETRSYPKFHPHITLAAPPSSSTLTLEQLREAISNSLSANLQVSFKSVNTGNHFFRSVYISIEPTPALVSLHTQIHNTLNLEPRTPLFPHLSLCYITDEDDAKKEERQRWKNQLEASSRIRYIGSPRNGIELNCCGDGAVDDWITGFTAYEIWFVDCVGPVESWSVLDKVRL
ncbi:2',3'-cyclic-nucleotide 3'-phosphodiesterase [Lentinula detonsa]|uniref:2',3'-cyclic-nucleotide 3'-phosphodiesterase n=1 Tax=Lentinula detonsa TaxID=2804962 RepID=A0AA38Q5M6_9AGAR|nr:2',3'-cyclic-nucleotide 3'-phosphodiesterase [Lentinula detonsa]